MEPQQTFTFEIDGSLDLAARREIAQRAIDYIINRTRQGQGPDGAFGSYSRTYASSSIFEAAGKSDGPVNLTLTGDMLDSIDIIDISTPGFVTIGFDGGENNDKAAWNREKGYNFLELTGAEIDDLTADFETVTPEEIQTSGLIGAVANEFLRNLFRGSG